MTQKCLIRVIVESDRGTTTELSVPGMGDFDHLLDAFRLVLNLLGTAPRSVTDDNRREREVKH
jgi:hypothetical protein